MARKHAYCSECGTAMTGDVFPKSCGACENVVYDNPTPVAVMIVPVHDAVNNRTGVLIIHRGPGAFENGKAFPGGFVEPNEGAERAAARELKEETGIELLKKASVLSTATTSTNNLLVFCVSNETLSLEEVALRFTPTIEASAFDIAWKPEELCFPLHTAALKKWFESQQKAPAPKLPHKDYRL